ncbi:MAG: Gfo/Idh/MocA family oxidoreductase [Actinomycetota bacterium]|nr:Gfo/Idh/MocA family oxidoreductase [Actinomycetota bacterium]
MTAALSLPSPRHPDPTDAPALRWGIIAPGWIASHFARAIHAQSTQRAVAVGSRTLARAEEFAARFEIPRAHGGYDAVLADPDVDVVYVASPHSEHRDQALAAIAAGKHVLVEKAFTRNAAEAREVIEAARAAGVLVMEAMWSRYLPHTDVVRQLLDDGALGDVHRVEADFGSRAEVGPDHRLLDPALAGGVLLDLGVYPLAFASFVARHSGAGALPTGEGLQVTGELAPTGVDAQVSVQIAVGRLHASLFTTMLAETPQTALVAGSLARVSLGPKFYLPGPVTLSRGDASATWDQNRVTGLDGLAFQAAALARFVAEGRTESPLEPLDETLAILETADAIRSAIGVRYPGE